MKHLHILTPTALLLLYLPQLSLSLCTIHSRTCPIPLVLLQPLQQENVTEIVPSTLVASSFSRWCGLLKKAPLWRTARRRLYGNKNHGLLKNMCSNQIPFNFKKNHEKGYFNSNCGEPFWPPPTLAVRMELPTTECWNLRYLRFGLHKSQKLLYDFNKAFNYLTSLLYLCHTWNLLGPSHHFFFVGSLRYDQWLNIKWSVSYLPKSSAACTRSHEYMHAWCRLDSLCTIEKCSLYF